MAQKPAKCEVKDCNVSVTSPPANEHDVAIATLFAGAVERLANAISETAKMGTAMAESIKRSPRLDSGISISNVN